MMTDILISFSPNADNLLRGVARQVNDSMLAEIAAADYGSSFHENLVHLRRLRDQASFATPMRWNPREVLELIRWSQPDDPNWKPGSPGERGHWMRAFACSALLRAAGVQENVDLREGWNQTLIQLIDSLRAIAPELYQPAAAFLAWLIPRSKDDKNTEELGFFFVGLLWFALHLQATDEVVVALSELADVEAKRQNERKLWRESSRWLLGTTLFDLRHTSWERLGHSLAEMDMHGRSPTACEWVRLIGRELAGT
jgi:hypothetical protein